MFTLKLNMPIEKFQADKINRVFDTSIIIFNKLVRLKLKEFKELKKTTKYRELYNNKKWSELTKLQVESGFGKWGFTKSMQQFQHHYSSIVGSEIAKDLALRVYQSFNVKLLYNTNVHQLKDFELNTITDRSQRALKYEQENNILVYKLFKYRIPIPVETDYEKKCLKMKVKYCSIKRVLTNYKWKYYLLLTIDGSPPLKQINAKLLHPIGKGDVGLDIGTRTLAITTPNSTELIEICDKVERHSKKKALIEEQMIRSLNSTNPGTSTSTGTRLKGAKLPNKSKRYIKLQMQHRELIRHMSELRRYQHTLLANYIISLGDNIMVEKMDYHKMVQQERSRRKIKRGLTTSIITKAPAALLRILNKKLELYGTELHFIDPYTTKASQFNHITHECSSKDLDIRTKEIGGHKVQRDLYASFLIMNTNPDLKSINLDKCNERFDSFLVNQEKALQDIENREHKLKSMG